MVLTSMHLMEQNPGQFGTLLSISWSQILVIAQFVTETFFLPVNIIH